MNRQIQFLGIVVLWLLFRGSPLHAQEEEQPAGVRSEAIFAIRLSGGYNTFQVDGVKGFYHEILQVYRDRHVNVQTQREFPGNLRLGVEASFDFPTLLTIGMEGYYTWSRAFSLYEDYSGTLDVNSTVKVLVFDFFVQKYFSDTGPLQPFIDARVGLAFGQMEFMEDVRFKDVPELNGSSLLSAHGTGVTAEGFLGIRYLMGPFNFSIQGGYRYGNIAGPEGELTVNNQPQGSGEIPVDINFSGFVVLFGIGRSF